VSANSDTVLPLLLNPLSEVFRGKTELSILRVYIFYLTDKCDQLNFLISLNPLEEMFGGKTKLSTYSILRVYISCAQRDFLLSLSLLSEVFGGKTKLSILRVYISYFTSQNSEKADSETLCAQ
jgi:hypothetical protein